MVSHVSIELINGKTVTISNPTAEELRLVNYWLDSDNKFYSVREKKKINKINKEFVIRVTIYEK